MHRLTAVASMTLSWSRSRSRVAERSVALGVRVRHGVPVVDAVDLGRLEQDLGVDLDGAQRGGRVGREVRVAGAGHEDRDPALLEVADGAAADVRLGDLVHRDRGHDPGRDAGPLERVLEGQAVHHRREHADVVAGRAVHARAPRRPGRGRCCRRRRRCRSGRPARGRSATWLGDERAERRVDAVLAVAEEGLAGQLEQDAPVAERRRPPSSGSPPGVAHSSSPTSKRTKRRTRMFSPIVAIALVMSSPTVWSVSRIRLLGQHDLLIPLLELAVDDLGADVLGLLLDRLVGEQLGLLGREDLGRDRLDRRVQRLEGHDLDREVLDELLELLVAGHEVGLAVDLDERAEPAARVDVGADRGLRGRRGRPSWPPGPRRARAAGRSPCPGRRPSRSAPSCNP